MELEGVSFSYAATGGEAIPALSGVDLGIDAGEFVAVMGANGSGKSTLARLLNALLLPERGSVRVAGLDTREPKNVWEVRRLVGMVFQNPDNQIVASIVEEDVAFGPENLGLPPAETRRRVREALAAVGLEGLADRPPHALSGGQRQRLAIAGALAMQPRCLVLDEATSMLDPVGRREVLATVHRLWRENGMTVVMVTHIPEEAAQAERVLVLDRGRLVEDGPPQVILADEERLRRYGLASPAVAQLGRALRRHGLPLPDDELPLDVDVLVQALCRL
ncbi:MAG: energy-coupling factor transporter ATPase [Clostridia bacterium]|nr:energy-coupling factor transporter ATPase [Clostridia bacterium]